MFPMLSHGFRAILFKILRQTNGVVLPVRFWVRKARSNRSARGIRKWPDDSIKGYNPPRFMSLGINLRSGNMFISKRKLKFH